MQWYGIQLFCFFEKFLKKVLTIIVFNVIITMTRMIVKQTRKIVIMIRMIVR